MELNIPANLCGLAIAEPLALDLKHDGRLVYWVELLRCYFLLLLQYAIQVYFIYQIAIINERNEFIVTCSDTPHDVILEMVCVFVFILAVWAEFDNSVGTVMLLWNSPSAQLREKLQERETKNPRFLPLAPSSSLKEAGCSSTSGAVLEAEGQTLPSSQSLSSFVFQMGKAKAAKPGMKQWNLDGMSRRYKVWAMVMIGLPKVFTTLSVGYAGGLYICYSKDPESLLQNSLAMTFVVEVENLLYKAFTPVATANHLEHAKSVPISLNNFLRLSLWFVSAAVYPVLTLCSTVGIVLHANAVPLSLPMLIKLFSPCDAESL
mmetsp:Transcript_14419/g.26577  ORF Transcript_14419/g.26577 Transcript_14419/m.26577 type:complete len:319 (-) Transcript_14419:58-1014(-)